MDSSSPDSIYAHVYKGPACSFEVKGLDSATVYSFRVSASNSVGPGPWSEGARARTAPAAPGAVEAVVGPDRRSLQLPLSAAVL